MKIKNFFLGKNTYIRSLEIISLFTGNKEFWAQSNGTKAIRILVNYSFKELGLNPPANSTALARVIPLE